MTGELHRLGTKAKRKLKHWRIRQIANGEWRARHGKVFALHPEYARPCPREIECEHLKLWRPLRRDVRLSTLRVCHGIAGRADPRIVPEEVFVSEVEPALNRYDDCRFLSNKNFYDRWFPGSPFPRVHFHNIDGEFYDHEYRLLDASQVRAILDRADYPVVIKPSMGKGGQGVQFPENAQSVQTAMSGRSDFVVQEKIRQHEFFRRFHDYGVNTLRVFTYRSVLDDRIHILNAGLRMGQGGSLDNVSQGGIARFVHRDGTLNHYAVD